MCKFACTYIYRTGLDERLSINCEFICSIIFVIKFNFGQRFSTFFNSMIFLDCGLTRLVMCWLCMARNCFVLVRIGLVMDWIVIRDLFFLIYFI